MPFADISLLHTAVASIAGISTIYHILDARTALCNEVSMLNPSAPEPAETREHYLTSLRLSLAVVPPNSR